MAIEIKENEFLANSDLNCKKGVYHTCKCKKKPLYFEVIRYRFKEIHLQDFSFCWKIMTYFGRILMSGINNCPYCGIDLEKEYQAAINPPEKSEQPGKSVDTIYYLHGW